MAILNNTEIIAGESVRIALRVENAGEQDGTFQADLIVNSETVHSKLVTVDAGENETIVFEREFDDPSEYEIAVADTSLETLTVTTANDEGAGTARLDNDADRAQPVQVTDATVPADWVKKGYETTVKATVVNTANRTANRTLTVTVDDQPVATETVTLEPNERNEVALEFDAVDGTVAVEGVDAGRISVSEGDGTVATETDDATGSFGQQIGLGVGELTLIGVVFAGVAIISVAVVLTRALLFD